MQPRFVYLLILGLIVILTVAACDQASTADPVVEASAADAVAMLDERTVIDVRTPQEYAAGHVEGSLNIDVQSDTFAAAIEELDKDGAYLVYCRSGRRSAAAAEQMAEAGFTDIVDAGGIDELAAAGAPLVR